MTDQPLDLDAIQKRADAATPAPWHGETIASILSHARVVSCYAFRECPDEYQIPDYDDGDFIAAARSDLPALVAEVRRLRAENARLREASAWRPIETAPKDGTRILALHNGNSQIFHWWKCRTTGVTGWTYDGNDCTVSHDTVTHFIPLPAPPAKPDGGGR